MFEMEVRDDDGDFLLITGVRSSAFIPLKQTLPY